MSTTKTQQEKAASTGYNSDFISFYFFLIKSNFGKLRRFGFKINYLHSQSKCNPPGTGGHPKYNMNCSNPNNEAWHADLVTWPIGTSVCVSLSTLLTVFLGVG